MKKNKEIEIHYLKLEENLFELEPKVISIKLAFGSFDEFAALNKVFKNKKIDKWEIGDPVSKDKKGKKRFVLEFKLKKDFLDDVLHWVKGFPNVNWSLWEEYGDPLIYWKKDDKKLFRYFWI
jgi:hypothetical protein